MAWRSHGKTNVELISNMARNGIIEADRVINVNTVLQYGERVDPDLSE